MGYDIGYVTFYLLIEFIDGSRVTAMYESDFEISSNSNIAGVADRIGKSAGEVYGKKVKCYKFISKEEYKYINAKEMIQTTDVSFSSKS